MLRSFGLTGHQVGEVEVHLVQAAITNTIPTMFWMVCFVFARPDLVDDLRKELEIFGDSGVIDLQMVEQCPLINAAYKETIRIIQQQVAFRRLLEDTTVTDLHGRQYLLKKDYNIQIPAAVAHHNKEAWGEDIATFRPERHVTAFKPERLMQADDDDGTGVGKTAGEARAQRAAYIPYGGGKHLCPGRQFAYTEVVGLLVMLIKGFELEPVGSSLPVHKGTKPSRLNAINRPPNDGEGSTVKLSRRKGWEKTMWSFKA